MERVRGRVRPRSYLLRNTRSTWQRVAARALLVYAVVAAILILAHGPLLRLPYYWDEAGQFIPAATDIYQTGAWISHAATPNVHPPGLMAWLALAWRMFGFSILTTRIAMLLLASFCAFTAFLLAIELSRGSPGTPAFTALALLCISPLFFAQSIMALLDMPAMGFTALALLLFLRNRFREAAIACVVLVMAKETGIVAPLVFGVWILFERRGVGTGGSRRDAAWFLLPVAALGLWLLALRHFTGHWLGNPAFASYNLSFPLNPARFAFALLRRLYYLFIGSGHFIGTGAFVYAWKCLPLLRDRTWRVAATLAAAHALAVTALGGALLERYLLPVLPILYAAFALALRALPERPRQVALTCLVACLIGANFINPPYPFPFENNLMFVSFIDAERDAAAAADTYSGAVATTFPMTTALANPDNGYLAHPHAVRELPDFRPATIAALTSDPPPLMIVYSTELDPWHVRSTRAFRWFFGRYYDYERPMTADEISKTLNMRITRRWDNHGFSMYLLVRTDPVKMGMCLTHQTAIYSKFGGGRLSEKSGRV